MEIRLASDLADIEAVAPLFDAYRVFYKQPSNLDASYSFLAERWKLRESVLYFACAFGTPVGFVHLFPSFASDRMARLWILNDLFVDPRNRRQAIARDLMQRAELQRFRCSQSCGGSLE